MKLHKKHRHNPQARLRKCLEAEKAKGPLLHPIFEHPSPRVKEIIASAEVYMTRREIYAILAEYIE